MIRLLLVLVFLAGATAFAEPPIRPDPKLTPGAALEVTKEDILTPGYSKRVRAVPEAVKREVYAEYGITSRGPREYEVDHLISLELGGSNSIRNLWPQSYRTEPWNARTKDRLENKLHAMVKSGAMDLKTAQQEIATDWIAAYLKYVGPEPAIPEVSKAESSGAPSSSPETVRSAPNASAVAGNVWVNTRSGAFWRAGSTFYGKTKEGKYMSEPDAVAGGFRAAKGQ